MIDKFEIQRLKEVPIESVAERLGLVVKGHKSLCPFHQDSHPSLTFNVAKNRFRCYVCGTNGSVIDLVQKRLNCGFLEACNWLKSGSTQIEELKPARKTEVKPTRPSTCNMAELEYIISNPQLTGMAKQFLFDERKLNPAVVKWLGISSISRPIAPFTDAPALLIPYRSIDGKLLTVQSRYLGQPCNLQVPRFRFPRGCRCHIYNQPVLNMLKAGEPLFISEGVTDCIALLSAGHKAIAIPSATLLNTEDLQVLKDIEQRTGKLNLHIYPDQDMPGEKLFLSLRKEFPQIVRHQLPAGCKDFSDYYLINIKKRNYGNTNKENK